MLYESKVFNQNSLNAVLDIQRDPKRLAREFLRIRGVSYKDLITGDHAADLFIEFNKAMIDWSNRSLGLVEETLKYMPMPAFTIYKEKL